MKKLALSALALGLVGCASTTIFPEGNGRYSLVSTSASESAALKGAQQKAAAECQKMGMGLKVLSHNAVYQGVDKRDKAMLNLAGAILAGNGGTANSSDDYKVTMKFRCQ